MSFMLAIEITVWTALFMVISFHLKDKHSWLTPIEPIVDLWKDGDMNQINMAGKIFMQIVASFFTIRFLVSGYILIAIYHFGVICKKFFIKLFKKR